MNEATVTVSGHRISDVQMRRALRVNILAGSLGMAWGAVSFGMPLTMLMEALGASGILIGSIAAISQVSLALQLPCALYLDRMPSRKRLWVIVNVVARSIWFVVPVLLAVYGGQPRLVAYLILGVFTVTAMMNNALGAAWWSWMADLVPETLRARFWGVRQSFTMAAFLAATAAAGVLMDRYGPGSKGGPWFGFQLVFGAAAMLGVLDIVVHATIPEPQPDMTASTRPWFRRVLQPLTYPDFRRLTLAMGASTFSLGLVSLGIVYLKKSFPVSYSQISAITIAANIGTICFGIVGGYIMQRIGGRAFGAATFLLAPLILLSWFFVSDASCNLPMLFDGRLGQAVRFTVAHLPGSLPVRLEALVLPQVIWLLLGVNFFAGALYGGLGLCQVHMCGSLAPREGRTVAMAVHWCVVGLIGAAGALIAGRAMDYFTLHPLNVFLPSGTRVSFHHVLVLAHIVIMWFVALPLQLRIQRGQAEPDFAVALSRLIIMNPVRAMTNIHTIGAAVASRRRAAAVRTLGERRMAIAVSDLIEKLDDPSSDVREETALALGRIGGPEAVDALLRKLADPESDLAPQIARALRRTRDPRSVDALVKRLGDPDRETRTESARTLGEIGDRRAVPSLLELLTGTEDAKVVSASSAALARLGELAAIYEILPRMKAARNPVLKRSLAVAIGDLLGKREGFYKVLLREQQTRGSDVARMLREIRRAVRDHTRRSLVTEGERLQSKTREVQDAYEARHLDVCVDALFDLAVGIAALNFGVAFGGDASTFLPDLVWRDEQFGVGVWYLLMLRQGRNAAGLGELDDTEILLGLYFLECHGVRREEKGPEASPLRVIRRR